MNLTVLAQPTVVSTEEQLDKLISENPMYFDENVFVAACRDIGQGTMSRIWSASLISVSTIEEVVGAVPEKLRLWFLRYYIYHFNRQLVT